MSDLFNLIDEKDLLAIYDKIDQNTPTNIYPIQESRSENLKYFCINSIDRDGQIFDADFNNKAEFIIFPGGIKYIKFYLPINIFSPSDVKNDKVVTSRKMVDEAFDINKHLISAYARGKENKDTMNVFVNGVKIPDKAVLLTIYEGMVDVYFQSSFLDEEINDVVFLAKSYSSKNPYCNYTWYGNTLNGYKIDANKKHFLYRNGVLLNSQDYVINEKGNIYVLNTVEDDVMEYLTTEHSLSCEYVEKGNIFHVHNLDFDFSTNPISPFIIKVFCNGYLINPSRLITLNGTYYILDERGNLSEKTEVNEITVYMNLTYLESDDVDYSDKFSKVNNLYNRKLISNKLLFDESPYYYLFPDYFNTTDMMMEYPPVYINNHIKNPLDLMISKREFCTTAINNYIKLNNSYVETFLNNFNQPEVCKMTIQLDEENKKSNYIVTDTTGTLPEYYEYEFDQPKFLVSIKYDTSKKFVEKIFVDGKLISRNKYISINVNKNSMVYFFINEDIIKENSLVEVKFEEGNISKSLHGQVHFIQGQDTYMLFLDEIQYKKLRFDILPFYMIKNGKHVYLTRYLDYDIIFKNDKLFVKILNKDIMKEVDIIYYFNPFIVYRIDKYLDLDETNPKINFSELFNEQEIEAYFGENNYNLEIYYKGRRLIDGIDFLIISPDYYNPNVENCIILNTLIDSTEMFTFIIKERRQTVIYTKESIKSRYGLMYINDIMQPYSKKYMDLYVNNKIVNPKNIVKYSNDFLQVRNINLFKYFLLVSNVDLPQDIISRLNDQSRSVYSFESFFKYLVTFDNRIDTTYEKVKDYEITSDEIIPTEPPTSGGGDGSDGDNGSGGGNGSGSGDNIEIDKRDLRYDILFMHFNEGFIDKKIACNDGVRRSDVDNYGIFGLFGNVIDLDANRQIYIYQAYQNANINAYSLTKISELFGESMLNPQENIDGTIDDFEPHKLNEYIYQENIVRLDANIELNKEYTYNANVYFKNNKSSDDIEEEVVVFGG